MALPSFHRDQPCEENASGESGAQSNPCQPLLHCIWACVLAGQSSVRVTDKALSIDPPWAGSLAPPHQADEGAAGRESERRWIAPGGSWSGPKLRIQ
eukprot:6728710-Pyramimonas_sp.AAC.1